MSKEKQIDEMAKLICNFPQCINYNSIGECKPTECQIADKAEALYNAGYRKKKHGTWYHGTENGAVYAKCSACGRKMNYSCYGYAYCSLCGARMDGAKTKGGAE